MSKPAEKQIGDNRYYRKAHFLISAGKADQFPAEGLEVAFAGRSNAGKSSAINTLCDNKELARTSKTPGRTRLVNFFALDEDRHGCVARRGSPSTLGLRSVKRAARSRHSGHLGSSKGVGVVAKVFDDEDLAFLAHPARVSPVAEEWSSCRDTNCRLT